MVRKRIEAGKELKKKKKMGLFQIAPHILGDLKFLRDIIFRSKAPPQLLQTKLLESNQGFQKMWQESRLLLMAALCELNHQHMQPHCGHLPYRDFHLGVARPINLLEHPSDWHATPRPDLAWKSGL